MQFHDLGIGQVFMLNDEKCMKVQPQKISCCKLKRNACVIDGDKDLIVQENQDVQKIEDE